MGRARLGRRCGGHHSADHRGFIAIPRTAAALNCRWAHERRSAGVALKRTCAERG